MTVRAHHDLVIVGGGIVGAWALHLAGTRHPAWRTLLIERSLIGDGATAHSAGVSLGVGGTAWERELAATSGALYAEAGSALGVPGSPTRALWIIADDLIDRVRGAAVGFALAAAGSDDRALLERALPGIRIGRGESLLAGGTPHRYEPGDTARAIAAHARRAPGATCWEGTEVASTQPGPDGVDVALRDGTVVHAARALVAVGPWALGGPTSDVARHLGIRIKKVVALHLDVPPAPEAPAVFLPQADAYLMPLPARRQWLFSFRSSAWDVAPGSELAISDADRDVAGAVLERYVPGMMAACRGGRVFCDAYAPSGEPVVARHPASPRLVTAGAGGGAGFRFGPGIAAKALAMLEAAADVEPRSEGVRR
jgi:glycine/D-amino acid oxidase-like deaminating enzyme